MEGNVMLMGVDGPPSPQAYKRAVLKYPPKEFTLEILSPAKHGSSYSYGLRVCPVSKIGDTASIVSNKSWTTDYEIWRKWEDCLYFQEILEEEYAKMAKDKIRGLSSGRGIKKGGIYTKSDFASSWESLPAGPDPNSIATDIHAYLPKLTRKGSMFRISQATIALRGREFSSLIEALWDEEPPTLVREIRALPAVRDFFGFWRRDHERLKKSGITGPVLSPGLYSTVSSSQVSLVPTTASMRSSTLPPSPMLLRLRSDDRISHSSRSTKTPSSPLNPQTPSTPEMTFSPTSRTSKRDSDDSTHGGSMPPTPHDSMEPFGDADTQMKFVFEPSELFSENISEDNGDHLHEQYAAADMLEDVILHSPSLGSDSTDEPPSPPIQAPSAPPRPPRRAPPPSILANRACRIVPSEEITPGSAVDEQGRVIIPHFDWPVPPQSGEHEQSSRSVLLGNSRTFPLASRSSTTLSPPPSPPHTSQSDGGEFPSSRPLSWRSSIATQRGSFERKRAISLLNHLGSQFGSTSTVDLRSTDSATPTQGMQHPSSVRDSVASFSSVYTQSSMDAIIPRDKALRRSLSSGSRRRFAENGSLRYSPSLVEEESFQDGMDLIEAYLHGPSDLQEDYPGFEVGYRDTGEEPHADPSHAELSYSRESINFSMPSPDRFPAPYQHRPPGQFHLPWSPTRSEYGLPPSEQSTSTNGGTNNTAAKTLVKPSSASTAASDNKPNTSPTFVVKAMFDDSIIVLKVDRSTTLAEIRHRISEKFTKQEGVPLSEGFVLGYITTTTVSPTKSSFNEGSTGTRSRSSSITSSSTAMTGSSVSALSMTMAKLDVGRLHFVVTEEEWAHVKSSCGAKLSLRIFDSEVEL